MATGKTIKEVVIEKGLLSAERIDELLDVHAMTKGGIMGFGAGGG
jgi:fumarate hydratase class II